MISLLREIWYFVKEDYNKSNKNLWGIIFLLQALVLVIDGQRKLVLKKEESSSFEVFGSLISSLLGSMFLARSLFQGTWVSKLSYIWVGISSTLTIWGGGLYLFQVIFEKIKARREIREAIEFNRRYEERRKRA